MILNKKLILASSSPRRMDILRSCGFDFYTIVRSIDESFPSDLPVNHVAQYLALKKLSAFKSDFFDDIILTADTVVIVNGRILNKPQNTHEAHQMLKMLSNTTHEVHTGIGIKIGNDTQSHTDIAWVQFEEISEDEINHYISKYKPFDKAGSYGVQDFIGMAKISKIEGSFYTVMGLPIHLVYKCLTQFIVWD